MARSTFKVLFYVNGSKEKDGIVPIMGRVTINGTVAQFSCKQNIPKTLWDVKGNKAKGKSREARDINLALDNIKAQIIKHYQRISDREAFVTAEMVRNAYQGIGSEYEIVEVNGEKWILSKRHKTKVAFQVKLLDIPLQIVERYRPMQKDNRIFPGLNYWSICKPLKRMIRECGITKSISFHCSRHGFATLALSKGMPIEGVSRVLGHTNIVTTQLYAKITTQKLDNDLTMFGDKLSKTFNGITMS